MKIIQVRHPVFDAVRLTLRALLVLAVLGVVAGCGGSGGGGGGDTGPANTVTNDFQSAAPLEGALDPGGRYSAEFYGNADAVRRQLADDNIPGATEIGDGLYALDSENWPDGWHIGGVIALRMHDGRTAFLRLLMKYRLTDGRLAAGVADAGILEAVRTLTIDSDETEVPAAAVIPPEVFRAVGDPGVDFSQTVFLADRSDAPLIDYQDFYNGSPVTVAAGFSEISLFMDTSFSMDMTIGEPADTAAIADAVPLLTDRIEAVAQREIARLGDEPVLEDGVVSGVDAEQADLLNEAILADGQTIEIIEQIRGILRDRDRLTGGLLTVAGLLRGTIEMQASASGSYAGEATTLVEVPVLVPVAGPFPVYLAFSVRGRVQGDWQAAGGVTGGLDVLLPCSARAEIVDGELRIQSQADLEPRVEWIQPVLTDIRGDMAISVGVTVDAALEMESIFSVRTIPGVTVSFEAVTVMAPSPADGEASEEATTAPEDGEYCVDVDWDLFGRFDMEAAAAMIGKAGAGDERLSLGYDPVLVDREGPPSGFWQHCWEAAGLDLDGDGYCGGEDCLTTVDCDDENPAIYPGAMEVCADDLDNDCDGRTDEGCLEGRTGYYPFSGNADDVSGLSNHGAVFGATLTRDRLGNVVSAYAFDGLSGHILVPHDDSLSMTEQGLTVAVRFKADSPGYILCKGDRNAGYVNDIEYALHIDQNWNLVFSGEDESGAAPRWQIVSAAALKLNEWYDVTAVREGNDLRLYINGAPEEPAVTEIAWAVKIGDLTFGVDDPGEASGFCACVIDEVSIYNRALTEEEIGSL